MKPYNPIITAFATLTVLLTAGCSSVRHASAQTDNRLYLTETNNSETIDAYREIHRRLRPLERPQVRYSIEEALVEGIPVWLYSASPSPTSPSASASATMPTSGYPPPREC